jgi:DNA-binding phage protein
VSAKTLTSDRKIQQLLTKLDNITEETVFVLSNATAQARGITKHFESFLKLFSRRLMDVKNIYHAMTDENEPNFPRVPD